MEQRQEAYSVRKKYIWLHTILPGVLAGLLILCAVLFFTQQNRAMAAEKRLDSLYHSAFEEVVGYLSNIDTELHKLTVVTDPQQYDLLLNGIWHKSGQIRSLLGQLPLPHTVSGELIQFITRTGDFCSVMNQEILDGRMPSAQQQEQLQQIRETCDELVQQLQEIQNGGGMDFAQLAGGAFLREVGEDDPAYKLNRDEEEYPHLIYDGPFSQSSEEKEAKGLSGEEVDAQKAAQILREFLDESVQLQSTGELGGVIPAWMLEGSLRDGRVVTAAVTKTGQLFYMSTADPGSAAEVTQEQAQKCAEIAQLYLQQAGFSVEATYSQRYSGYAVVNLAAVEQGIVLYPDLIKVWVDAATGEITGFDFRNYLMAHKERSLQQPMLRAEEAKAGISQNLQIDTEGRLCVIPKQTDTEVLCYEFSGMCGEDRMLVYINALSGREEEVLLILDTENGTLVE